MNRRSERKVLNEIPIDDIITDRYYQKCEYSPRLNFPRIYHKSTCMVIRYSLHKI